MVGSMRAYAAVAVLALLLSSSPAGALDQRAVASTPTFAFHSDFETNLHDALATAAVARARGNEEMFSSGAEKVCFSELRSSSRSAWNQAVDYYAEIVITGGTFSKQQYLPRLDLAGYPLEENDEHGREYVEITRHLRRAAAAAYRACRWEEEDAENRRWIEHVVGLLDRHENATIQRLKHLYRNDWASLPIRVDVVQTAGWSGGSSAFPGEDGGHLLMSTSYEGDSALEIVLHEASHGLMLRESPVQRALGMAAKKQDMNVPEDLWHVVLFFTTGEVVREALEREGREYTPMIQEIFDRGGPWTEFEPAVESLWPEYLRGGRSLDESAEALLRAIRSGSSRPVQ